MNHNPKHHFNFMLAHCHKHDVSLKQIHMSLMRVCGYKFLWGQPQEWGKVRSVAAGSVKCEYLDDLTSVGGITWNELTVCYYERSSLEIRPCHDDNAVALCACTMYFCWHMPQICSMAWQRLLHNLWVPNPMPHDVIIYINGCPIHRGFNNVDVTVNHTQTTSIKSL